MKKAILFTGNLDLPGVERVRALLIENTLKNNKKQPDLILRIFRGGYWHTIGAFWSKSSKKIKENFPTERREEARDSRICNKHKLPIIFGRIHTGTAKRIQYGCWQCVQEWHDQDLGR